MLIQSVSEARDWWDFWAVGKDFGLGYQVWDMVTDGVWTMAGPLGLVVVEWLGGTPGSSPPDRSQEG